MFNATFNNVSVMMDNVVTSFIGINATFNKLSAIKCTPWWTVLLMFNATFNNVSVMMDNVVTSFIGI